MFVFPDSHVMGNAPTSGNGAGFDHHQCRTAHCPAAKVHKMKSVAKPSSDEYMHSGDIAMRLRNVTPRTVSGDNRSTSGTSRSCLLWHWVWMVPAAMLPGSRCPGKNLGYFRRRAQGDSCIVHLAHGGPVLPLPSLFSSYWDMILPSLKNAC